MRPPVLRSFLRAARPPETFTLSLHDALPISVLAVLRKLGIAEGDLGAPDVGIHPEYDFRKAQRLIGYRVTRQMTEIGRAHVELQSPCTSYAVFCLKKKNYSSSSARPRPNYTT